MFFSEEKNQKTFIPAPHGHDECSCGKQKSFASFLQKRSPFYPSLIFMIASTTSGSSGA
jgi:hypothetical protein